MEKVFTFFSQIPADKARHAIVGGLISMFVLMLALPFLPTALCCVLAAVTASAAGYWKEYVYDVRHANHTPDGYDWLATTLGGLAVSLPPLFTVLR